jgi:methyl-accepting chemotaxis protein
MTMTGPRAAAGVLAVALAFAAGCGGGDDTSSAEDWAGGVCDAITTWQNDLQSIATDLRQNQAALTKSSLQSSVDDATSATQTLAKGLKDLGKPDTEAGEQAKSQITTLSNDLSKGVDSIKSTIDDASGAAGVLNAVSVASGTLATMTKEVSSTVTQLEQLDPNGELKQGFQKAPSCKSLTGS